MAKDVKTVPLLEGLVDVSECLRELSSKEHYYSRNSYCNIGAVLSSFLYRCSQPVLRLNARTF